MTSPIKQVPRAAAVTIAQDPLPPTNVLLAVLCLPGVVATALLWWTFG